MRYHSTVWFLMALTTVLGSGVTRVTGAGSGDARNVILVLSDDHRYEACSWTSAEPTLYAARPPMQEGAFVPAAQAGANDDGKQRRSDRKTEQLA